MADEDFLFFLSLRRYFEMESFFGALLFLGFCRRLLFLTPSPSLSGLVGEIDENVLSGLVGEIGDDFVRFNDSGCLVTSTLFSGFDADLLPFSFRTTFFFDFCFLFTRTLDFGESGAAESDSVSPFFLNRTESRGDLQRGDLDRGDLTRGDLARGDLERGDLARGDFERFRFFFGLSDDVLSVDESGPSDEERLSRS